MSAPPGCCPQPSSVGALSVLPDSLSEPYLPARCRTCVHVQCVHPLYVRGVGGRLQGACLGTFARGKKIAMRELLQHTGFQEASGSAWSAFQSTGHQRGEKKRAGGTKLCAVPQAKERLSVKRDISGPKVTAHIKKTTQLALRCEGASLRKWYGGQLGGARNAGAQQEPLMQSESALMVGLMQDSKYRRAFAALGEPGQRQQSSSNMTEQTPWHISCKK